ncbi:MAG: AraC family transcriptional regulator [Tenuifilaceae bacterium]|nr:AraC family transcriptional regulator [Tenuifilaceae bacterium]
MKRKSFFNALLVLLTLICSQAITPIRAASGAKDSLLLAIPNLKDTERLEAIRQLTYTAEDTKTGIDYCRWLQREAAAQGNLFFQSFALGKMVEFYYPRFDSDSIFIVGQRFEDFCRTNNFYQHYFIVVNTIIIRHEHQGNYTLALDKSERLYQQAKRLNNPGGIASALYTQANIYTALDQPDQALRLYNECLGILKESNSPDQLMQLEIYQAIATLFIAKSDYQTMRHYVDTCMVYIDKVSQSRPEIDLTSYRFNSSINYVFCHAYTGNLEKAEQHLRKAAELLPPSWPENYLQELNQARACYHMFAGNYGQALLYNQQTIDFYTQNRLGIGVKYQVWHRAEILERMGDYRASCMAYARLKQISDSLNTQRISKQIGELKTIYELDKAELEAAQARHRLQISRYLLAGAITFSVLLAVIILIILRSRNHLRAKNLSLYRQIKEQDKLQAEQEQQRRQKSSPSKPGNELMERLEELMRKDKLFTNPELSRKMLADRLSTNETYLFEAIRDHLGLSVSEYIAMLRLNYARELLSMPAGNLTIEAVAIDSGFGSRNTFHRLFRERFGLTPTEFRRLATME